MRVVPRWIFVINMKKFSMTLHRPFKKKKYVYNITKHPEFDWVWENRIWLVAFQMYLSAWHFDKCAPSHGKSTLCCSYITGKKNKQKKRITCLVILNVFEDLFCGFLRARSSSPTFSREPLNETKKMRQTYHQSIINMSVSFYILLLTVNKPVATNPDYFFFFKVTLWNEAVYSCNPSSYIYMSYIYLLIIFGISQIYLESI